MVADDPEQFAIAIERVYRDEPLWQRLAAGGIATSPPLLACVARQALDELFALADSASAK